ncbi:MAG TPA: hypothetical protein VIG24_12980 [Acidimicrobiia bacterium]
MIWGLILDYYLIAYLILALLLLRGVTAPVAMIIGGAFALVTCTTAWLFG